MKKKKKTINAYIPAFIILMVTAAIMVCSELFQDTFFPALRDFSRIVVGFLSKLTSHTAIPVWEIAIILIFTLVLFTFIRMIVKKQSFFRWFGIVLTVASAFFFVFTAIWGVNHYAPPISDDLGIAINDTSEAQLIDATKYYMAMAEYYAEQQPRDADGTILHNELSALGSIAGTSYRNLSQEYPVFRGSDVPVKYTRLSGEFLSYTGTTGIFICFTGESTVNDNTYVCSLPLTMCHEAAHRCGIAAEDEANFAAFLACTSSDDPFFRYSGYYSAFLYCYNALYSAAPAAARGLWNESNALLRADLSGANAHYAPYEGKVQDTAQRVNDIYLKTFSEEAGVQSYGNAADYLINWYLQKINHS